MTINVQITPTLFIFMGTSSGDIGWRIKKLIKESYGDIPVIRFLWIDTDSRVDSDASKYFTEDERIVLTGFNIHEVLSHLENYPEIEAWWPQNTEIKGYVSMGAPEQMRLAGRLSLFYKFDDRSAGDSFIDKLRSSLSAISEITNIRATKDLKHDLFTFDPDEDNVHIVPIFSTSGGTGSSISFDVAYLSRHILKHKNPKVIALSIMPTVIEQSIRGEAASMARKAKANTYAWFKEDNYLMKHPDWFVRYPDGTEVELVGKPFDIHFLINKTNERGLSFDSYEDAALMAAWAMYMSIGGNVGSNVNSFNQNVDSLGHIIDDRITAYSSQVAASLVFPIDKLKKYCGAKMGKELLDDGLLAEPNHEELINKAARLADDLDLIDEELIVRLTSNEIVEFPGKPLLAKPDSVQNAMGLLDQQYKSATEKLAEVRKNIQAKAKDYSSMVISKLETEIASYTLKHGLKSANELIDLLLMAPDARNAQNSMLYYLGRIQTQKIDSLALNKRYQEKYGKIRAQEGGIDDMLRKAANTWKKNLQLVVGDAVSALENYQNQTVTSYAITEASKIYNNVISHLSTLKLKISALQDKLSDISGELDKELRKSLQPATADQNIFDLSVEMLCEREFFDSFYLKNTEKIDRKVVYSQFAADRSFTDFHVLEDFFNHKLGSALVTTSGEAFNSAIESVSLLTAMEEFYGTRAKDEIEKAFDDLIRYSSPFWVYEQTYTRGRETGTSIIGVENPDSHLIPEKYRNHRIFTLHATGLKHQILLLRLKHGVPAFLFPDLKEYRNLYEQFNEKTRTTLHILPGMEMAEEVFPELNKKARRVFALGNVFGYIAQVGNFFYYDPDRIKQERNIEPPIDYKLAQGREKADESFGHKKAYVDKIDKLITSYVAKVGNVGACGEINAGIEKLQSLLSKRNLSTSLKKQYMKEMEILQEVLDEYGSTL